jgi:predicted RNase H-like HicB family nuclease
MSMNTQNKADHQFAVGQLDDGSWLAYSDHAPYFCFAGPTDQHVIATADRALKFYHQTEGESEIEQIADIGRKTSLQTLHNVRLVDGDGCDVN